MSNSILLAPGPVQLHPEVKKILSQNMIHHRGLEFDAILKSTLTNLKFIFQTTQPVFALTATGSGGMECLLINVLAPGEKVLALISGKFGERWADMAEAFGANVIRHNIEWGKTANPKDVENILKENSDIKIVLSQACETSTGTKQPIEKLSQIINKTDALFLVDGITALGAYDIPMDAWGIDGLVGGSQKAFMLPTGMAFVCFSEKAWRKIKTTKSQKFYFNIENELAANLKGETLFSSNVLIIRALDYVLKSIQATGLKSLFQTIERRANYTKEMMKEMGLELYSYSPSNSVTAIKLPANIDGVKFRTDLELKHHVVVMGGQDALKGKIIRIGHMGYITDEDMHQTTLRLAQALNDYNHKINLSQIEEKSNSFISGKV